MKPITVHSAGFGNNPITVHPRKILMHKTRLMDSHTSLCIKGHKGYYQFYHVIERPEEIQEMISSQGLQRKIGKIISSLFKRNKSD